eukprot:Skav216466  [mRNA]  locus=scaffold1123:165:1889:+ [translate_table: standard]
MEDIVALHSVTGPSRFQPYALNLEAAGLATGNQVLCFVVMTRTEGLMIALPEQCVPEEIVAAGNSATREDLAGPSQRVTVNFGYLVEDDLQQEPAVVDGQFGTVLLMDFHQDVASYLNPISAPVGLEGLRYFEEMDYLLVPVPGELIERGLEWSLEGAVDERMQFYSAEEEVPETPPPAPKRSARRKVAGGMPGDPASPAAPKAGRVTVAKLAESLEAIHAALPNITTQLQELTLRTAAIEEGGARPPDRQSALRRPIGSSTMIGSAVGSSDLGVLVGEMPPPRGSRAQAAQAARTPPRVTFSKQEAEELAEDFEEGQTDLTKAMLQQSRALTALVSHMAMQSGDPFLELGATGSSSSMSTKGSAGRARLQTELAQHRGTFFVSVLQSMSRRMYPAQLAEVDMSVLRDRGVTPTQYLERFGGYGRVRDIGFIQWQLALAMNHLQEENWLAAKDGIALLFTMLEQTAMDNGKMDVGLLLSLQEDPPQTVFTGRSLASGSTPRPFAPTAHQRWITTALQYLKEMDVISTRRQEATKKGDQNQGDQSTGAATKAAAKKKGKGRGRGGQTSTTPAEDE